MLKREVKVLTRSGDESALLRIDDASQWDTVLTSIQAQAAAGSALVLRPSNSDTNLTGAPAAPAQDATAHTSIGPGCRIPDPIPQSLDVGLTVVGGVASIRVELSRHSLGEDHTVDEIREVSKKLDAMKDRLDDAVTELRIIGKRK